MLMGSPKEEAIRTIRRVEGGMGDNEKSGVRTATRSGIGYKVYVSYCGDMALRESYIRLAVARETSHVHRRIERRIRILNATRSMISAVSLTMSRHDAPQSCSSARQT